MNFTSFPFLFLFLPIFFIFYFFVPLRFKNLVGAAAGLVFLSFGHLAYLPLYLGLIALNFALGRRVEQFREQKAGQWALWVGIVANLLVLAFFKTIVGYGTAWLQPILPVGVVTTFSQTLLPLGLSYIIFQLISYLVDVHHEACDSEKNFIDFSFYVLMFPKLISGPIVRYRSLAAALAQREVKMAALANGLRRFARGLAKKALIADPIGRVIQPWLQTESPLFQTPMAWFVLIGFALQLYFDFSGYSDMAIGLGEALGFKFIENFNTPYISKSIAEFWRRWHISLSTWFRDTVFFPLEYKLRFIKKFRQQITTVVVFLLTGLWHGFTPTYIIWGGIHGLALAAEIGGLGKGLKKAWAPLQHLYALAIILFGWVFFCSPSPAFAWQFLERLGGWQAAADSAAQGLPGLDGWVWLAVAAGGIFSLPVPALLGKGYRKWAVERPRASQWLTDLVLFLLFAASIAQISVSPSLRSIYGGF
jgi:alginate O-acetyltransferase complex protein AlgI